MYLEGLLILTSACKFIEIYQAVDRNPTEEGHREIKNINGVLGLFVFS